MHRKLALMRSNKRMLMIGRSTQTKSIIYLDTRKIGAGRSNWVEYQASIDAGQLDTSRYRIGHTKHHAHAYIGPFITLIQHGDFATFSIPTLSAANCYQTVLHPATQPRHTHHEYLVRVPVVAWTTHPFVNLGILIRRAASFPRMISSKNFDFLRNGRTAARMFKFSCRKTAPAKSKNYDLWRNVA